MARKIENRLDSKATSAKDRATARYAKESYDRFEVKFRKEDNMPEKVEAHCKKHGYVINTLDANGNKTKNYGKTNRSDFVKRAIETQMLIDNEQAIFVKK